MSCALAGAGRGGIAPVVLDDPAAVTRSTRRDGDGDGGGSGGGGGGGGGSGGGSAAGADTARPLPHEEQNFAKALLECPQRGQTIPSVASVTVADVVEPPSDFPQPLQNFASSRFSAPQLAHCIAVPSRCMSATCMRLSMQPTHFSTPESSLSPSSSRN